MAKSLAHKQPSSSDLGIAVDRLRRSVAGEVLATDDAGYDRARRVWNG